MLSALEYIHTHGLDHEVIEECCQTLGVVPIRFDGVGGFTFGISTKRAPFICCVERDNLIDVVAWPPDQPEAVARMWKQALLLGRDQLENPASWAFGGRLKVHRSALDWLKGGCKGVVVLDHERGFLELRKALGPLEAEDEEHGLLLDRLMHLGKFPHDIVVP